MNDHGTYASYHAGCRCEDCRLAGRTHRKAQRERLRDDLPDGDPRHGTRSGYSDHGCRCIPCTVANRDYTRAYTVKATGKLAQQTDDYAKRFASPPFPTGGDE